MNASARTLTGNTVSETARGTAASWLDQTDTEREQAFARVLYVIAIAIYLVLASRYQWDPTAKDVLNDAVWFIGYSVVWALLVTVVPGSFTWRRVAAIVVDVLAVSYAVAKLHGLSVVFVPLYIAIAAGNGLRYGVRYLYLALGLSLTGFVVACSGNPFWVENRTIEMGLLAGIAGIPPFFSMLLARLNRSSLELARLYSEMERLATHDMLTGLPNPKLLYAWLTQSITAAQRHSRLLAVLFLDLDDFKQINDQYGHAAGDCLLKAVAGRLNGSVRRSDLVSRVGGDEFVIVLTEIKHVDDTGVVADKVTQVLSQRPFDIEGRTISVTTSIGVAIYPHAGDSVDALVKHADVAMYQAKQRGRNRYCQYEPALG